MSGRIAVTVESTRRRAFATAADWPGWSRSGRTEPDALAALAAAADRYASIAVAAGLAFPGPDQRTFEVLDRLGGGAGTDFGVPSLVTALDRRPVDAVEAARFARLLAAAWAAFDRMAAVAPESLRKGPRGGGRDTSKIVQHVVESDQAYAREIGVRVNRFGPDDRAARDAMRAAMLDVLRQPSDGSPLANRKWPARHAANYITWHALDHAWEIEDRSAPVAG